MTDIASSTCNETEELWYSVCYDYFHTGVNKEAIEWFQCIGNDDDTDSSIASLTVEQIDLYKKCGIYSFSSQDNWYKYDNIKNKARSAVHNTLFQEHISSLLSELQLLANENKKRIRTNASIFNELNLLLIMPGTQIAPLLWTMLDHICIWINKQQKWNVAFMLSVQDPSFFTELPPTFLHPLLALLCALGDFEMISNQITNNEVENANSSGMTGDEVNGLDITLSWVFKSRFSDAFLTRIRRKIESFRPYSRPKCQESPHIGFSETSKRRTNVDGGSEISFCFLL